MPHFMIEITYCVPVEQLGEIVTQHRTFLQLGYECGWLLMSGPQNPKTGGIVIARAPSLQALKAYFQDDPYLLYEVATHRYVEFEPVKRQEFLAEWVTNLPDNVAIRN
jgi:uncharacterized protein YciI